MIREGLQYRKLRIFLVPTLNVPVVEYRMGSMVKYMKNYADVVFTYYPHTQKVASAVWERNPTEKMIKDYDALVDCADVTVFQMVKHKKGFAIIAALKERYPHKLILTECDDDVFSVPAASPASKVYIAGGDLEWTIKRQIEVCDGCVVSTHWLKKRMEFLARESIVVKNTIDIEKWGSPVNKTKESKTIKIGWFGGGTHDGDLRIIKNVVTTILNKYKNVKFYILGGVPDLFLKTKRVVNKHVWYMMHEYPKKLKNWDFDICLAPLRDSDFNRAKSNLRWLESSAMGIPAVVSRVGEFKRTVIDGKTGMLATEEKEWVDKLSLLIENKELRIKIGTNARKEIEKNWNKKKEARRYVKQLEKMYNKFRFGELKKPPMDAGLGTVMRKEVLDLCGKSV